VAGLCYSVVFLPDFFRNSFLQNWSLPAIKFFSIIGLGSFISSAAFYPCWLWYRQALHRRHAECRRFLGMLLEARSEASKRRGPPVEEVQDADTRMLELGHSSSLAALTHAA
jgi:hypothetical protein